MRRWTTGIVAMMLLAATGARAESPISLTVRLYNSQRLSPEEVMVARQVAEPILRDAGMEVRFRQCGTMLPGGVIDRCNDPLKPAEVVVRVITAPHFSLSTRPEVFGVAHILEGANRGWLATLYADRITTAETRLDLQPGTLLGRVLAHEVGHLLIGSDYHGDTGLMRADWTDEILTRKAVAEWSFSPDEASIIQHLLAARF